MGARGGPVDLIRQHNVREERPPPELEFGGLGIENRSAGNVVWQQIRRALDSLERAADTLRDRPRQHCLGHSRNVLQQQMSFGEKRNQRQHDFLPLADHHLLDVIKDLARHRGDAGLAFFPVAGGGQPVHRYFDSRRLEAAQDRLAAAGRAGHFLSRHLEWKLNILSTLAARACWHRFNNRSLTTPIGLGYLPSVTPKLRAASPTAPSLDSTQNCCLKALVLRRNTTRSSGVPIAPSSRNPPTRPPVAI